MPDHTAASSLAQPVLAWMAEARRLRSDLDGLDSSDMAAVRAATHRTSDQLALTHTASAPAGIAIDDLTIAAGAGHKIRVRRYRPAGVDGPLPTQIWMHGGGFITGTVDEVVGDRTCAARTAATGVQTLAVEYRLAPEHGYPAPVDDAIAVFDAAVADSQLSADVSRIGIGGNSAGGTIAASTALKIRDTRGTRLVHQLLEVPQVTFEPFGPSSYSFDLAEGPLSPPPAGKPGSSTEVAVAYLSTGVVDQYTVPLDAELAGLPPTLVMTAEFDPLRDGAEEYVQRLRAAGVDADGIRGDGHLHATCSLTAVWEASRHWQAQIHRAMIDGYRTRPTGGPGSYAGCRRLPAPRSHDHRG